MGDAVSQLVETLPYKSEGRGFNSQWCHSNFSLTQYYGPGVDSANGNDYQRYFLGDKGGRCIGLIIVPSSCQNCHEILESQRPPTLRACTGVILPFSFAVRIQENSEFPCIKNTGGVTSFNVLLFYNVSTPAQEYPDLFGTCAADKGGRCLPFCVTVC
jgi:hypothetical protein